MHLRPPAQVAEEASVVYVVSYAAVGYSVNYAIGSEVDEAVGEASDYAPEIEVVEAKAAEATAVIVPRSLPFR